MIRRNITLLLFLCVAVGPASCAPVIHDFLPKSGPAGTEVTIEGARFGATPGANIVRFAGTAATDVTVVSPGEKLIAKVPAGAKTGLITVTTNSRTGESPENFRVSDGAEWTFMVYLDADNNLESAGIDDFLEMAEVGSNSQVNIIVQMDRIAGLDNTNGNWTGTRRFRVKNGDTPASGHLADLGEQNMGHPDTLRNFVTWAVNSYPAKRYALVIWNHGDGWRKHMEARVPRARSAARGLQDVTLRAIATDDTDGDVLYMSEVQSALTAAKAEWKRSATSVKLDVLGFDACLMGMVEVGYAVRNLANFMVGSEELEPGDGWPYDTILAALVGSPTWDGRELSTTIVTKYGAAYANGVTQSAVDLSKLGPLVLRIDLFAIAMNTEWAKIKQARTATLDYHPWGPSCWGVDLWHFADNVRSRVSAPTIKIAAQAVKNAVDDYVVAEHHSPNRAGSHGVAIYFPPTKTVFNGDPDSPAYVNGNLLNPVQFVDHHIWDEFLETYYTDAPAP